jgi:hypothetical protein
MLPRFYTGLSTGVDNLQLSAVSGSWINKRHAKSSAFGRRRLAEEPIFCKAIYWRRMENFPLTISPGNGYKCPLLRNAHCSKK